MDNILEQAGRKEKMKEEKFDNTSRISNIIDSELDKYLKLSSSDNISQGEKRAYEENVDFFQNAALEANNAKEWIKVNPGKGWDDYTSQQMKTWYEKFMNSPEKLKANAEKKYRFYQKLGSIFQEQDVDRDQKETDDTMRRNNKINEMFEAIERGGGSVEVQEAKLKLKDLKIGLEQHSKDHPTDKETLDWYEREIDLNQRVVKGEKLTDVLSSMQTKEDKKRIEEARERLNKMEQL